MKTFDFENMDEDGPESGSGRNDSEHEVRKLIERLKQGSSGSSTAEALEEIVNYYCEAERFQDALPFANLLLEQATYSSEAWQKKGVILNHLQRFEEALDCLDKALALNPADQELLISRGITLDNLNRCQEAVGCFDQVLSSDSQNDEALFSKALTLEKLEQFDQAMTLLKGMLERNPDQKDAWYELGFCYDSTDRLPEALDCYEKYLDMDPFNPNAWYNRGIILNRMGQYVRSIESYDFALALKEDFIAGWYNRGNACANLGRLYDAVDCYRRTLKLDERDVPSGTTSETPMRSWACTRRRSSASRRRSGTIPGITNPTSAAEAVTTRSNSSGRPTPTSTGLWRSAATTRSSGTPGRCGVQPRQWKEALHSYRMAVRFDPSNIEAWFDLGETLLEYGYFKEALKSFNKCIELQPVVRPLLQPREGPLPDAQHTRRARFPQDLLQTRPR